MDNIKTLLEKQEYELVIKLTEHSMDNNDVFCRITAFLGLGDLDNALSTLKAHRKDLEKDLPLLMKTHIDLLCLSAKFDEAYQEASYYQNLPYHSQQAEEILKEMNSKIRNEERKSYSQKEISDDELRSRLLDKDETVVLFALEKLKEKDVNPYLKELRTIIKGFPRQTIRTFALFQLVEKHIDLDVEFLHNDNLITVNPSKLKAPFIGKDFSDFVSKMQNEYKDVSISNNATNILSSFLIYIYPDNVPFDDNLLEALYEVSCKYLQVDYDQNKRCKSKHLDVSTVKHLTEYIILALADF